MLKINNNISKVGFGMNECTIRASKSVPIGTSAVGTNLKPLSKDIFTKTVNNIKNGKVMNNKEKQVKLLNDYVNYNINFKELIDGREKLKNNSEPNDKSVDENIETLFENFYEDTDYTQTDFSYDARELLNIYRRENKYPNIIKD